MTANATWAFSALPPGPRMGKVTDCASWLAIETSWALPSLGSRMAVGHPSWQKTDECRLRIGRKKGLAANRLGGSGQLAPSPHAAHTATNLEDAGCFLPPAVGTRFIPRRVWKQILAPRAIMSDSKHSATSQPQADGLPCSMCDDGTRPNKQSKACDKCQEVLDKHPATQDCPDAECALCGIRDCGEPLHYHHDGCPSCGQV